jgi:8-oxo-dGTP diphosphatase
VSSVDAVVVAAVIERDDCFLLTLRQDGTHLAGHWEFPGGKVLPTETHSEALRRELHEELDIVCSVGECLYSVTHTYPEKTITLYFYRCGFEGEPKPMLGQEMRWVRRADLRSLRFPDADAALIERLVSGSKVPGFRVPRFRVEC